MPDLGRAAILGGVVALLVLGLPLTASAHALAQASSPAAGAILQQPPAQVSITFGETPDPRLSSIGVEGTDGKAYQKGRATASPGDPKTLVVGLLPLPKGVYTVAWRTFSAVDGHIAAGTFAFGVGVTPPTGPPAPPSSSTLPPLPTLLARALLLGGLTLALGAAFASTWVFAAPTGAALRLLGWGTGATLLGTLAVLELQRHDAGVPLGQIFDTSLAQGYVERLAAVGALALGTIGVGMTGRGKRERAGMPWLDRAALWLAISGAAAAMLIDALASHAAAGDAVLLNGLLQWLHVLAVGVWIGGLATLLASLPGLSPTERGRSARRFSNLALVALLVVGATGVIRAAYELGAWGPLLDTGYGILILAKAALLLVLFALGAVNRLRNVPAVSRTLGGLVRVGSGEMVVAAAAIVVASALVNMAPPVSVQARQQAQAALRVSGQDFGATVHANLVVTPGSAGFNHFTATLEDPLTHRPVDAELVSLTLTLPERPDLGASTLTLARTSAGVYAADGGNLSLNGDWSAVLLVQRGAASTEVHLRLTPTCPPTTIDRAAAPGQPTLYTAHLCGGDTLQVYLDPGSPGADELHATFFDAAGNELAIDTITMTETAPGGAPNALTPRRLEAGHFVADVTVSRGTHRVDVTATTPTGRHLSARFDIAVAP